MATLDIRRDRHLRPAVSIANAVIISWDRASREVGGSSQQRCTVCICPTEFGALMRHDGTRAPRGVEASDDGVADVIVPSVSHMMRTPVGDVIINCRLHFLPIEPLVNFLLS